MRAQLRKEYELRQKVQPFLPRPARVSLLDLQWSVVRKSQRSARSYTCLQRSPCQDAHGRTALPGY